MQLFEETENQSGLIASCGAVLAAFVLVLSAFFGVLLNRDLSRGADAPMTQVEQTHCPGQANC